MSPEQHAKVLEALEIAHNAALNEALELRVRQGGYMNHRQKGADTITDLMSEALSIMRADGVAQGFPKRILDTLKDMADRNPKGHRGPWEYGDGTPMQDDAEAALAWIAAAPPTEHEVKP